MRWRAHVNSGPPPLLGSHHSYVLSAIFAEPDREALVSLFSTYYICSLLSELNIFSQLCTALPSHEDLLHFVRDAGKRYLELATGFTTFTCYDGSELYEGLGRTEVLSDQCILPFLPPHMGPCRWLTDAKLQLA